MSDPSDPLTPAEPAGTVAVPGDDPVLADCERQADYMRFMPLVKWLLAIPHYLCLIVLGIGAWFAMLFAAFAVLFTGVYPRGIFDFVVGVYRWAWRVGTYVLLMTDEYPPFSLDDRAGTTTRLAIEYPEHVDRWRPFVQWLLAIPYLIVAGLLGYVAAVMSFFAFFTILFTRKYPQEIFDLTLIPLRWNVRGNAYAGFLTTKYPPWIWS